MTLINDTVKKLFGHKQQKPSVDSPEFIKHYIENADDVLGKYYEYTPDDAIKDALFEYTDIAKSIKNLMETRDGNKEQDS